MITRLQDIQLCLPRAFQSDDLLKNRILNACTGIEACRLSRQKVAPTLMGVVVDLQTSISTFQENNKPSEIAEMQSSALVTDRRRHQGSNVPPWRGKRDNKSSKRCFVCKRFGCWSTNHSPEERKIALKSNTRLRAFVMDLFSVEHEPNDNGIIDDNCVDELEDLAVNIDSNPNAGNHLAELTDNDEGQHSTPLALYTEVSHDGMANYHLFLQDASTVHSLAHSVSPPVHSRYSSTKFYGIAIDTCCAHASTCGIHQNKAYCNFVGCNPDISKEGFERIKFGIGETKAIGTASCIFPVDNIWFTIVMYVVDVDVPILLSLVDMDRLCLAYDNTVNILTHKQSGAQAKIQRIFGHPFLRWSPTLQCICNTTELRRLHRRFGHPAANKLHKLLLRARPQDVSSTTWQALKDISQTCELCQFESLRQKRFNFTLRDDKDFNHSIYVDIMTLEKKPVLHIVDEASRYQATKWLPTVSSAAIWRSLRLAWIDAFLGPPDLIVTDAANALTSEAFRSNASFFQINTKAVPVEAAQTMSVVERYHEPLRRAYRIIRKEAIDMDSESALQAAVKAVNDSVGPDGLVPTLLVYGAFPRLGLPSDALAAGVMDRARAVSKAAKLLSRYFAQRKVRDARPGRNGPDVTDIHKLPLGAHVPVYRIHRAKWTGPYPLLDRNEETCKIIDTDGPKQFRTTVAKPYHYPPCSSLDSYDSEHSPNQVINNHGPSQHVGYALISA